MSSYRKQVADVVRAATVLSPTRCAWLDRASPELSRKTLRALDAGSKRAHLSSQLVQRLYTSFYQRGAPGKDAATPVRPARSPALIDALSRANAGTGCWTSSWIVRAVEGTAVVGEKDGLRLRAREGSWRYLNGAEVHVGASVDFLETSEQLGISPGFYLAQGNLALDSTRGADILRVYWNATANGAVLLMAALTRELNDLGLPFRFKVVSHLDCYARCDSAVLYLRQADFAKATPVLERAWLAAAHELEHAVPALTKQLGPGVAVAENPGEGMSFGWQRCELIADALIDAYEHGVSDLERRVDSVAQRFARNGLCVDAPYLNAGSVDRYRRLDALGTAQRAAPNMTGAPAPSRATSTGAARRGA